MNKSIIAVLAFLAVILLAPTDAFAQRAGGGAGGASSISSGRGGSAAAAPWIVIGCVGGTVLSAMVAN